MRICVINGPNLNLLGTREPDIYGHETLADLESQWRSLASDLDIDLRSFQSNSEGALIDGIQALRGEVDAIVLNAGALTHYSLSLADALTAVGIPFVEVHISNVYEREPWRHHSVLTAGAEAVIVGRGTRGYLDAIRHLHAAFTSPPYTVPYGAESNQVFDVRIPAPEPLGGVVIIHGGYWHRIWLRDLMDAMAVDLTARGYVTFNLEYATGPGSYPAAEHDIAAAIDLIIARCAEFGIEPDDLVVVGHSAGGYFALRVAAARDDVGGVVALAPVTDLTLLDTEHPDDNPARAFLGGSRNDLPDVWADAAIGGSPLVPVHVIHGVEDEDVEPEHAEWYVQETRGVARLTMLGGVGHMELIDPDDAVWTTVFEAIRTVRSPA